MTSLHGRVGPPVFLPDGEGKRPLALEKLHTFPRPDRWSLQDHILTEPASVKVVHIFFKEVLTNVSHRKKY